MNNNKKKSDSKATKRNGLPPSATIVDVLSFTPPAGWETTKWGDTENMMITHEDKATGLYCQIIVFTSRASSGCLRDDFSSEWSAIVGGSPPTGTNLIVEDFKITGIVESVPFSGRDSTVFLVTVLVGGKASTVVVTTPDVAAFEVYQPQINAFFGSIGAAGSAAAGTSPTSPLLPASEDRSPNSTIRMSDIVGEWTSKIEKYSAYPGDMPTFFKETFVFKADKTFTKGFVGWGAKKIDEAESGTYTLVPGLLHNVGDSKTVTYHFEFFRDKIGPYVIGPMLVLKFGEGKTEKYNIIGFTAAQERPWTLSFLDAYYVPNGTGGAVMGKDLTRDQPGVEK